MRKLFSLLAIAAAVLIPSTLNATAPVTITLPSHYFTAPATVQLLVTVEPAAKNRVLRIEADSEEMFLSSEMELIGVGEKRLHAIQLKNLAAGDYTMRAAVLSDSNDVIAMAQAELVVAGR